jgi:hypothetical protein
MVILLVTAEEWLSLGLQSVGFGPIQQNRVHQMNLERFWLTLEPVQKRTAQFFLICRRPDRSSSDRQAKHFPFSHGNDVPRTVLLQRKRILVE